jgi:predicted transporter
MGAQCTQQCYTYVLMCSQTSNHKRAIRLLWLVQPCPVSFIYVALCCSIASLAVHMHAIPTSRWYGVLHVALHGDVAGQDVPGWL